ncbi:hypothetical protein CYMTET_34882 [Cymbomonas tetramitiformis]|uniref:Uncharacterized protein n=1 Tax=Cymbomonas tetramitiformis TaxID=36881 RepID=A0AAE0KPF2_9CHLO|nr:hypothetical protein CYMTET_34882 [Cymbomonas tetramitiformis]
MFSVHGEDSLRILLCTEDSGSLCTCEIRRVLFGHGEDLSCSLVHSEDSSCFLVYGEDCSFVYGEDSSCARVHGEYPLSFAVSTGSNSMVQYLVSKGADVNANCDRYGHFAVHMAVVHRNSQMYTFLVDQCGASQAVRNRSGYTPLELAARLLESAVPGD